MACCFGGSKKATYAASPDDEPKAPLHQQSPVKSPMTVDPTPVAREQQPEQQQQPQQPQKPPQQQQQQQQQPQPQQQQHKHVEVIACATPQHSREPDAVSPPTSVAVKAVGTVPSYPTPTNNAPGSNASNSARGMVSVSSSHADAAPNMTSINQILRLNLAEVKFALQKLAGVNTTPSIALCEAAELLCKHLSVSLCSITGFTDHCTFFIFLAAYGTGAEELEKSPVMRGNEWSHSLLLEQPSCLHYKVTSPEEAEQLPPDFRPLYDLGLSSFLSIQIATDHEVVGALTIAKEEADGFEIDWWEPMLGCLTMGLLAHLRDPQTFHMCQLMRSLDTAPDYISLIHQMVKGARILLLRAKNIQTGCRLALINRTMTKALLFEPDQTQVSLSDIDKTPSNVQIKSSSATVNLDQQMNATEIVLDNTLLLDAIQKGKARFVSDCASYIQTCMSPATDIFISGNEMVVSIVVLPLKHHGEAFGGFYVTLETTSNFQNIKDLLMGFVNSMVLILQKRILEHREHIWETIMTKPTAPSGAFDENLLASMDMAPESIVSGESAMQNRPIVTKRNGTQAMLKVLQNEIRRTTAKNQAEEWIEELVLTEVLGKGGFGIVYKGTWKGSVAAVKVMYARQHERQAMKDALEMALLTTVSHPFIIQVYSCLTDMVEDVSCVNQNPGGDGRINVRFRRLRQDEDRALATCNILVMEYCDRATLRHAMKKGIFHKRVDATSVAVDLCLIVQVLLEVAQAIQHLHALKLIHCDIKPENVLMKSDPAKAGGFMTKLSDFGLAKILRDHHYIVNRSGSGTVTHLAPELFQVGSKITTAVDTFSFGIMMWELYTGQRAHGGLGRDAIIDRVYKKKVRPTFPLGVPTPYSTLATACWDNDPQARPTFVNILAKLTDMLQAFSAP